MAMMYKNEHYEAVITPNVNVPGCETLEFYKEKKKKVTRPLRKH